MHLMLGSKTRSARSLPIHFPCHVLRTFDNKKTLFYSITSAVTYFLIPDYAFSGSPKRGGIRSGGGPLNWVLHQLCHGKLAALQ